MFGHFCLKYASCKMHHGLEILCCQEQAFSQYQYSVYFCLNYPTCSFKLFGVTLCLVTIGWAGFIVFFVIL